MSRGDNARDAGRDVDADLALGRSAPPGIVCPGNHPGGGSRSGRCVMSRPGHTSRISAVKAREPTKTAATVSPPPRSSR